MSEPYAFGIEEEYFLADAATGASPSSSVIDAFHVTAADEIEAAEHELRDEVLLVRADAPLGRLGAHGRVVRPERAQHVDARPLVRPPRVGARDGRDEL